MDVEGTRLWTDLLRTPDVLARTLREDDGTRQASRLLRSGEVRRLVAVGNGASSYIAHALWLASLETPGRAPVQVLALPAGLLTTGRMHWQGGDALLSISASGEARDLVSTLQALPDGVRTIAVTSTPASTVARLSDVVVSVAPDRQESVTHSHAYCGAVLACLALWAETTEDDDLRAAVRRAPDVFRDGLAPGQAWAEEALAGAEVPTAAFTCGSGAGWAAALEASLLVKELAQVPGEGVELREAATTVMTTIKPGHLLVNLTPAAPGAGEAEDACAGRGARVLRAPAAAEHDLRLSPVTSFPAMTALALRLTLASGADPDAPAWRDTYFEVARERTGPSPAPAGR
jgi:fructoselysine-6-P-deglycase FrlB-like protein